MLLPWNTDAPIYHFPWASIGLIAVNVAVFAALEGGLIEEPEDWILAYGDGLHPLQWVTSNFMHAGVMHLVGNMIFLWGFGLVVEGKIGWWRFLLVFLGIGIVQSGCEQALTQHLSGGSLGASAILYGLLAIALVWAPRNEMSCVSLVFRVVAFDIPIIGFSGMYLGLELFNLWWDGFSVSTALLHLSGAVLGFGVGVAMLKLDWVDCESWDLFAVLAGREGQEQSPRIKKPKQTAKTLKAEAEKTKTVSAMQSVEARARIATLLAEEQFDGVLAIHRAVSRTNPDWQLSESELLALIKGLHARQDWNKSIPLMVEYAQRWPQRGVRMRLKLAQMLLSDERPQQALIVLEKIPAEPLDAKLEAMRRGLRAQAQKQLAEGAIEFETHDW